MMRAWVGVALFVVLKSNLSAAVFSALSPPALRQLHNMVHKLIAIDDHYMFVTFK